MNIILKLAILSNEYFYFRYWSIFDAGIARF